jgi:putative transposase
LKGIAAHVGHRYHAAMPDCRRARQPGGGWLFTVSALQRQGNDLLTRQFEALRDVVRQVRRAHPFAIHGWVVLPEHLHCVIELPPQDTDSSVRWRPIKAGFSKRRPSVERHSSVRRARGERGIGQRRYR